MNALRRELQDGLRIIPGSPEAQLRVLFGRERDLERELVSIRAEIAVERRRYATREGLITPPRVERLRSELLT